MNKNLTTEAILNDAINDALLRAPQESCGLIVSKHRRNIYVPCRNTSMLVEQFAIHPEDLAEAEDTGTILAVVHSHPTSNPNPSQADLIGIEHSQLPWLIVNPITRAHTLTEPSGYVAPLIGREFVHGITDCYSLIRDYYERELNISLPNYVRQAEWWLKGDDLYMQNFQAAGFVDVATETLNLHDVLIMRMSSPVDNHGGVYVGNNLVLQHVHNKLSSRDVYGGYWRDCTTHVLRHESLI